jgi:tetratricopeptide (TPR) repeat protein
MRGRLFHASVVFVLVVLAGCAAKTAPPVVTAPRYPSFIFPGVPPALTSQPRLADRHRLAWNYLQSGDLRTAEREFEWVTGQLSTFFPSEVGLGYVALARREHKQALEHFELALAVAPNYPSALVGRGEALLAMERPADAIVNFEAAIAADPSLTDLRPRIESMRFRAIEQQVAAARKARDAGRLEESVAAYQGALAASPDSGFLYRELAATEQRLGRADAALAHATRALELDPSDVRAHVIAGEIFEAKHDHAAAIAQYEAAAAIEPSDDLAARIAAVRERAALAELPAEYHEIAIDPAISRAQLAALIGVRLEDLVQRATRRPVPVMTDTRGNWASPWIAAVVRAGVMDPFPNHTFQPAATIRRVDLAVAISRLLALAGPGKQQELERWRAGRPKFDDLPPAHLSYAAAALAVEAKVLDPVDGQLFQPGRAVSGAEAIEAIDRVEAISREPDSPR